MKLTTDKAREIADTTPCSYRFTSHGFVEQWTFEKDGKWWMFEVESSSEGGFWDDFDGECWEVKREIVPMVVFKPIKPDLNWHCAPHAIAVHQVADEPGDFTKGNY